MADYDADPPAGQAIIEEAVGAEIGSLATAFDGVDLYDLAEAKALMTGGEYGATLKEVKDIALAAGIMADRRGRDHPHRHVATSPRWSPDPRVT